MLEAVEQSLFSRIYNPMKKFIFRQMLPLNWQVLDSNIWQKYKKAIANAICRLRFWQFQF